MQNKTLKKNPLEKNVEDQFSDWEGEDVLNKIQNAQTITKWKWLRLRNPIIIPFHTCSTRHHKQGEKTKQTRHKCLQYRQLTKKQNVWEVITNGFLKRQALHGEAHKGHERWFTERELKWSLNTGKVLNHTKSTARANYIKTRYYYTLLELEKFF